MIQIYSVCSLVTKNVRASQTLCYKIIVRISSDKNVPKCTFVETRHFVSNVCILLTSSLLSSLRAVSIYLTNLGINLILSKLFLFVPTLVMTGCTRCDRETWKFQHNDDPSLLKTSQYMYIHNTVLKLKCDYEKCDGQTDAVHFNLHSVSIELTSNGCGKNIHRCRKSATWKLTTIGQMFCLVTGVVNLLAEVLLPVTLPLGPLVARGRVVDCTCTDGTSFVAGGSVVDCTCTDGTSCFGFTPPPSALLLILTTERIITGGSVYTSTMVSLYTERIITDCSVYTSAMASLYTERIITDCSVYTSTMASLNILFQVSCCKDVS